MRVILIATMIILLTTLSQAEELKNCADCHGSRQESYFTKKIKFAQKVTFVHKSHFNRKKSVNGVEVYCTTCHQSQTRHFGVSKESCYLCHFKNNEFNEGLSRCSLCHEIPQEPLQQQMDGMNQGEEIITHRSLEEAQVPCRSCHLEIVKGTGSVNMDKCLNCHGAEFTIMREAENRKLMHKEHVSAQNTRCFHCHAPIEHKRADFMEVARNNCQACHPDHHINQKRLLAGDIAEEVPITPGLMFEVKTNCMGCHIETKHDRKGEKVLKGSSQACVVCHTVRQESMLKEWKDTIREELEAVEEVKRKAEDALKKAHHKVPEEMLWKAIAMLEKGQEFVNVVKYGNGVHNKKYSITLIDFAFYYFEDVIDLVHGEEMEVSAQKE